MSKAARQKSAQNPKKRTIADFLAAADDMDEAFWEALWEEALDHVEEVEDDSPPIGRNEPNESLIKDKTK